MKSRLLGGLAATATAVALLAGCSDTGAAPPSGGGAPTAPAPSAAPSSETAHNAADTAFVQGMIPHHRQATAMSALADTRAASPEVKELATRISGAQQPEIEQMNRMLTAWGTPPAMPGMDPNAMSGMGGMMSPDQMGQLENSSGAAFDRMFLQMMIEHHTGAIQMARTELTQGQNAEAKQLAQAIIDAQQREILQMQSLLGRV